MIGTAERCLAKLRQLESLGVRQFNIYSMVDDPAGVIESFGALAFGPEHAVTLSFMLLILFLLFRPTGITGKRGYE